jgi:hypothetical protein
VTPVPWRSRSGANLYDLAELAEVLARRVGDDAGPAVTCQSSTARRPAGSARTA